MADKIVEQFEIRGDSRSGQKAADDLGAKLKSSMIAAEIATKAYTAVAQFALGVLKDGVAAAAENERTTLALAAALRGAGQEIENNSALLEKQSNELERVTGVSDEAIRKAQTYAVNMGLDTSEINKFVKASISMSNTLGGDVNSAMEKLIKTKTGLIDRTMKAIPGIQNLSKEALAAGDAADLLNVAWGENLDLLNQGITGQWNALSNEIGNFAEAAVLAAGKSDLLQKSLKWLVDEMVQFNKEFEKEGFSLFAPWKLIESGLRRGEKREELEPVELVPLVPPQAGGSKKGGKKGGRRSGDEIGSVDMDWAASSQEWEEQNADIIRAAQDRVDALVGIKQDERDRRLELEESITLALADQYSQRTALEKAALEESRARNKQVFEDIGGIVNDFAMQSLGTFIAWTEGANVAFEMVVADFLKSTGTRLIAQGLHDTLVGASRIIFSWGTDPSGYALATQGGVEIGAGAVMLAGGIGISAAAGNKAAVSRPSASGGGGAGGGGPAYGSSSSRATGGGGPVTINVLGALTTEETAVLISRGMERARQRGLIR